MLISPKRDYFVTNHDILNEISENCVDFDL